MAMISLDRKIHAVKQYYAGSGSLNEIAAKFGVHRSTLQKWLLNYELFGEKGLCHCAGKHHYPAIVKQQAAESYLSGQMSIEAVCKKYHLRTRSQMEQWVMMYNGQKGFRSPGGRRGVQLTMASYEERKAAVEYCIAHEKNYKLTAEYSGFTYQQIYGWVQRYQKAGLEGFLIVEIYQSQHGVPGYRQMQIILERR